MRRARSALLLLGAVCLLSCGDDPSDPCSTLGRLGIVEGELWIGGAPAGSDARVSVTAGFGDGQGKRVAVVQSDSTGWYRLELPVGTYSIDPESRLFVLQNRSYDDTIHAGEVLRRDFHLGALDVRLSLPPVGSVMRLEWRMECSGVSIRTSSYGLATHDSWRLVLRGLPPGNYRFAVREEESEIWVWLPETLDPEEAMEISLGSEEPLLLQGALTRVATVSGTVTGTCQAYGNPLVTAFTADSLRVTREAVEDDGRFDLQLLPAVPVKLLVQDPSGATRWIGGNDWSSATLFDVGPGDQLEGVDSSEGGIRMQLDGPGHRLVYRGSVLVEDDSGWSHRLRIRSAEFPICNLAPGRYRVQLIPDCEEDWAAQWYGGAARREDAAWIDVEAGELRPVSMSLQTGGRIEGRLLGSDGSPLATWAGAHLLDPASGRECESGFPGDPGRFSFLGLADGSYYLRAQALGVVAWFPGTTDPDSAQAIVIRDHGIVAGLEWRLPMPPAMAGR